MNLSAADDLQSYIKEHLQFIRASSEAFDKGSEGEAKRLAVSARVLFHDTGQSHSLMGQLGLLSIPFYSTAGRRWNPKNGAPYHGLLQINMGGRSGPSYRIPLDDRPPHMLKWVSFDDWWLEIVFDDKAGNTQTRKQLILALSNKEGGAHVDPNLTPAYVAIAKNNTWGWLSSTPDGDTPLPGRVELLGMRQIAHEIVRTLEKSGYT